MLHYREDIKKRGIAKVLQMARKRLPTLIVLIALLAGIIGSILVLRGGTDVSKKDGKKEKPVQLQEAQEVRLGMFDPASFAVYASTDEDIVYLNQIIYESLFSLDEHLNVRPQLVASYSCDEAAGKISITLRDASFSDGTALTAEDVARSVGEIKETGAASPYYAYASRIDTVEVSDDKNLTVYFAAASDAAPDNLTFPIAASSSTDEDGNFRLGSGVYAYGDYEAGKSLVLKPNEHFDGRKAKPVHIRLMRDKKMLAGFATMDAVTAFLSKDADADALAEEKNLSYVPLVSGEMEFLSFNIKTPALAKSAFRQAVARGISRKDLIADDYGGAGTISDSLYFPGFLGVKESKALDYSPGEAARLLSACGYKDGNEDGILEDSSGTPLHLRLLIANGNQSRKDGAETIAANLKSLGIAVEVQIMDAAGVQEKLKARDFDIFYGGMRIDKQFRIGELFGTYNYGQYENADLIAEVNRLEHCLTPEEQKDAFAKLKKDLNKEVPYFCLCYRNYGLISVKTLSYQEKPLFFDPYRACGDWTWKEHVKEQADAGD